MKKIIAAACILTIVLFVFPLSSFAKGKGGQEALVCGPFGGDIQDLEFDFGDGFDLELMPGFVATITEIIVEASGQETTVVIPPKQFIYNANLSAGWEGDGDGKIFAIATLNIGGYITEEVTLVGDFTFATIFEQFKIKKKDIPDACEDLLVVTPKKVDIFFEVTNAQLIGITDLDGDPIDISSLIPPGFDPEFAPFNLVLVIDKGKLVVTDVEVIVPLPTPLAN